MFHLKEVKYSPQLSEKEELEFRMCVSVFYFKVNKLGKIFIDILFIKIFTNMMAATWTHYRAGTKLHR